MKNHIYHNKSERWLLNLAFTMTFALTFSQQSSFDLPNYHPVSPNAASLGSFGLYPVNKNLGTVMVDVPIYTIRERGLSVPINLSYNSSGIKLNELASWVGLGWTLNAGGIIVRNVKGQPDIAYNSSIPDLHNAAFTQANYQYMLGASKGLSDTAPDQYVLNALGITATFYFDQNHDFRAVFEDGSPIDVTVVSSDEMHVKLEDGTLLIFGKGNDGTVATERTRHYNPNYILEYISAWYLTEVVSIDRRQNISFRYKSQLLLDGYAEPSSETIYINGSFSPSNADLYLKSTYQELSKISRQTLEKISFDNGHIDFDSSLGRDDLQDDYRLDAIKLYVKDAGSNGKLVDQYHFTYDYFQRSAANYSRGYEDSPIFFSDIRQANSREKSLKLLTMYRGASPDYGQVHSFDYNETQLPYRCTTAQDAWGHPNSNLGTLLPQTVTSILSLNETYYYVGSGDRSVNETKMKAAILEKITYPTGGYTVFEHEANRFLATDPVYVTKKYSATAYGNECTDSSYPHYSEVTFTIPTGAKNIKLHMDMSPIGYQDGSTSYLALDGKFWYRPTPDSNGGPSDSSDGWSETISLPFGYNLGDIQNPMLFQEGAHTLKAYDSGYGAFAAYDCSRMGIRITWDDPNGTQQIEKLVGGLRIKAISDYDGISATPKRIKRFAYADPILIQPEVNRGYIRFTILDPDIALTPIISTSPNFNNNLGGEPVMEYGTVTEYDQDPSNGKDKGKTVSYYENIPPSRILNSVIGPQTFKHPEFRWDYFFAQALSNGDSWSFQGQLLMHSAMGAPGQYSYYETNSWRRGKLLREVKYKIEEDIDVPVAELEHQYTTIESFKLFNNFIFSPFPLAYDGPWNISNPYDQSTDLHSIQFCYQIGETELGRRVLTKTVNTDYDDNGQNPAVTTTNYHYDNLVHKQLTRTESINSSGETIETTTYYPDDVIGVGSLDSPDLNNLQKQTIDKLKGNDLHRIAEPIQMEMTVKNSSGTLISNTMQRTNYKDWDMELGLSIDTDLILPDSLKILKGTYNSLENPMQVKMVYHKYNAQGNPEEISKDNGPNIYYIWGYNDSYPIAKLENFSSVEITASVQNLLDAAVSASNLDTDNCRSVTCKEELLRKALAEIREHIDLSDVLITSYTYDPLVGMTSMTDPKGYTIYYIYDNFNRLKEVRDSDSNLVSDYGYHYKGATDQ